MTSRKIFELSSPSVTQCHKICIPRSPVASPFPYRQLWVPSKGQSGEIRLRGFELQSIRKQPSNGVSK